MILHIQPGKYLRLCSVQSTEADTFRFEYSSTLPARPTGVVNFRPYVEGEAPYASFHFFYRNQGKQTQPNHHLIS